MWRTALTSQTAIAETTTGSHKLPKGMTASSLLNRFEGRFYPKALPTNSEAGIASIRRRLRWRLRRLSQALLLLLEVPIEGFEVKVEASHLLGAKTIQLVNDRIAGHWVSPSNSSGVQM